MSGINRRGLITGLISLVAAPAIVRAGSLMPVRMIKLLPSLHIGDIVTFEGIKSINRHTMQIADVLQQFVVTYVVDNELSVYPFSNGFNIGEQGLISIEHAVKIGLKKVTSFDDGSWSNDNS